MITIACKKCGKIFSHKGCVCEAKCPDCGSKKVTELKN
jgi:predicted Zn-ribbon and HTH transcriptional regulator